MRVYGQVNFDRLKDSRLRRLYGITLEQYSSMYVAQGGRCALCREPSGQPLHVDHDHSCCPGTGSQTRCCGECVRWLLCGNCNIGLGYFKDSLELLERASAYLVSSRLRGVTQT